MPVPAFCVGFVALFAKLGNVSCKECFWHGIIFVLDKKH